MHTRFGKRHTTLFSACELFLIFFSFQIKFQMFLVSLTSIHLSNGDLVHENRFLWTKKAYSLLDDSLNRLKRCCSFTNVSEPRAICVLLAERPTIYRFQLMLPFFPSKSSKRLKWKWDDEENKNEEKDKRVHKLNINKQQTNSNCKWQCRAEMWQ